MVPDEPDLLRHVTQLDVRDNGLTELDASVFPRLEVLHCERNCITSLKVKGCLLKGIYASNNGAFGTVHVPLTQTGSREPRRDAPCVSSPPCSIYLCW